MEDMTNCVVLYAPLMVGWRKARPTFSHPGTSIGANNAEATNAISKADFKSKSYIALKEARESLYWLELLHRNNYLTDVQFQSLFTDCEELVRILVTRCKKLDQQIREGK